MSVLVWVLLRSRCQERIITGDLLGGRPMKENRRELEKAEKTFRRWRSSDTCKEDREGRLSGKSFRLQWGSKKALSSLMGSFYASHPSEKSLVLQQRAWINTSNCAQWLGLAMGSMTSVQMRWWSRVAAAGTASQLYSPQQETWVFSRLP